MKWNNIPFFSGGIFLGLMLLCSPAMAEDDLFPILDKQIPHYTLKDRVSGEITIMGSNTMHAILEKWKDKLEKIHPRLKIHLETGGSNTGVESFIKGKTQIAAMSRPMNTKEVETFTAHAGYPPSPVPIAVDAFAVFVHKDNPLDQITFQQLDAVFSSERRRGVPESLDRWGQLGLSGDWKQASIQVHGRDANSGTAQLFRELVMLGSKDKETITIQPGAASVVVAVMNDPYAIGYSGIGYRTNSVKPLKVAAHDGESFVEPTFESAINGSYPLRRLFYLYVNHPPDSSLSPILSEVIKFSISFEGQQVVAKSGFFPLPTKDLLALSAAWSRPVTSAATHKGSPERP